MEEKRFFESVANLFKKFERISQSFQALDRGFQKTPNNYDPTRYVRANRLLLGINANELPPVKSKEKYSFQDYLNSKGGNKPSDKSGGNTNINNMTFGNRGSNYGGNFNPYQNPNLNNQQSFTSNNYNNPYEQPKVDNTNPYSYEAYKARINPSSNQNKTNISSNANNEFTVFENSFSNKNKSQMRDQNDMRQTTVVPPTDMYTMSQKGEQYNPYSSISLGDQSNVTNPRPSNPNYSVLSNNQYMTQPGVEPQIGNYSQMTPNQFNYNNNNPNNSYRNSSYPTPDNNLKFPK